MNLKTFGNDFLGYIKKRINNPALPIKPKKQLYGLFSFKEIVSQNTAIVTISSSITIVTDSEQWSYAAFFPSGVEHLNKKYSVSPAIILIEGYVKQGRIGIGSIHKDFQSFSDEMVQSYQENTETFYLVVDPLKDCYGLIVRNCRDDHEPSVVEIHSIRVDLLERIDEKTELSPPPNLRLAPDTNWNRYYGVTPETMIEKVRLWEYKEIKEPMVMRWIENLCITIYPGNEIHEALYLSGLYEPNTMLAVQKLVSPGCVFLDVGANVGCYTLFTSRIVGSTGCVCAFEPSSREYRRLVENIRLNDLTNVIPVNAAVTETRGKRTITIACEHHSGHNTMGEHFMYDGVESIATEEVETITLDEFVRAQSFDRVDVIKLDIEGGEYKALLGASEILKEYQPVLIIEVLEKALKMNGSSPEELESLLVHNGYRFWQIDGTTAELQPIQSITQLQSENIIAIH